MKRILVTGSTGFIGSALTKRLKEDGYWVRGVDIQPPREWDTNDAHQFFQFDLRNFALAKGATRDVGWVFHLAANMGGMGHIATAHAPIIRDNTMINANVLEAAREKGVKKYLFPSSACVYPRVLQGDDCSKPLKEEDAYPADCGTGYGWEKLHGEHLCHYYRTAGWLDTKIVRLHNVYGSKGSWRGGREKAPAALCRKVAVAKLSGNPVVEIWGDGKQKRSFMYIDDCIEGMLRLMESDFPGPLNLGRDKVVTIDELVDIIADIAGIKVEKKYVKGPQGVRSRNSDNSLCKEVLGWAPSIPLEEGLVPTYKWIKEQVILSMETSS